MSSIESPWIREVVEQDFEREVLERSREAPVVVDFWAPWCRPCLMLAPVLERLVHERQGQVRLAKVNVDDNQQLAGAFNISGIPAVIAFRNGEPFLSFTGVLPEEQLRDFLDRLLPTEADHLVKRAAELEAANPAEAEELYSQVLQQDRNREEAALGLARLLVAKHDAASAAEAADLLDRVGSDALKAEADQLKATLELRTLLGDVPPVDTLRQRVAAAPEDAELRYQLGAALAKSGNHTAALAELLAAAERDRTLARGKVKELMVKLFQVIGVRSPLADEYRDKLVKLLY